MANEHLTEIARKYLGIQTLETRNSDSLDFYDLGVGRISDALEAAYRAGQAASNATHSPCWTLLELS